MISTFSSWRFGHLAIWPLALWILKRLACLALLLLRIPFYFTTFPAKVAHHCEVTKKINKDGQVWRNKFTNLFYFYRSDCICHVGGVRGSKKESAIHENSRKMCTKNTNCANAFRCIAFCPSAPPTTCHHSTFVLPSNLSAPPCLPVSLTTSFLVALQLSQQLRAFKCRHYSFISSARFVFVIYLLQAHSSAASCSSHTHGCTCVRVHL